MPSVPPLARPTRRVRLARRAAVTLAACVFVPVLLLWIFQDKFLFVPSDEPYPVDRVAAGVIEVPYRTADGIDLTGWFLPARRTAPGCALHPAVVVFHGLGGNKSWLYPTASVLADRGISVLLAEYRGYGGSSGTPGEDGFADDARAALDALRAQPGVDPAKIVYVGASLGTGVAARLAVDRPPAGLVLLAPYTSIPDMAQARLPGLPYRLLLHNRFDTLGRIGTILAPTLVVLGTADEMVPSEQSRRVSAAAGHPDGLVEVPGVGHEVIELGNGGAAYTAVVDGVARWTGCALPDAEG